MQKVISINLNGNAYHLEEAGYDALRAYLDLAAAHLKDNPDRAEILADLEQAIAEKCAACLGRHKSVVSAAEADRIIAEMGPVRDPGAEPAASADPGTAGQEESRASAGEVPKRLYQIREGAMITGVCNGLAAYFNIDVTIVRIVFIVLALLTHGFWLIVYVVMSFFIPFANTADERAAAHGMAFSAQDLMDRTKKQYRRQQREWARQWRRAQRGGWAGWRPDLQRHATDAGQVWARALAPLFGVVQALLFVLLAFAIVSLVNDHAVFGWAVPSSVPLWAGLLVLVVLYQVATAPFQAVRYAARGWDRGAYGSQEAVSGLLGFAAIVFGLWIMYQYIPEVREFVHDLPTIGREVWSSFKQR